MAVPRELPEIKYRFETPLSKLDLPKGNEFSLFTKNRRSMANLKLENLSKSEEEEKKRDASNLRDSINQRKQINRNIITINGKITYKRRDILELKEYYDSVMETNNGYEFSRMFPNERGVMTFK